MPKVRFGTWVPQRGSLASTQNILTFCKSAEDLGFDYLGLTDHINWPADLHPHHLSGGSASVEGVIAGEDPNFFELFTTLSYIAGITEKIRLMTGIMVLPTRDPILAAKQAATLDTLSNGRLIFGVGLGANKTSMIADYDLYGVSKGTRLDISEEHLAAIKTIWTNRKATFKGRYVNFSGIEIFPHPVQNPHPPIFYGGGGTGYPKSKFEWGSMIVGKYCDGFNGTWLLPDEYLQRINLVKRRLTEFGRGNVELSYYENPHVFFSDSKENARKEMGKTIQTSLPNYERKLTLDEALDRCALGTPDDIIRKFQAFVDIGVTNFGPVFTGKNVSETIGMLKVFQKEVAPSF